MAIDSIFISPQLVDRIQGGFLNFGNVMISNHHVVWIDIPAQLLGFDKTQNITKPAGF